ncbi:MAG: hypothetical protein KJO64_07975 [Bacteroidia bacterium]|nr:hypothetical protein [Bacteroidia bacterium]
MEVKYPDIEVELVGKDGNTFAIIAEVSKALNQHGVSKEEIKVFHTEAMSGDYNNVLVTCMKWVNIY